MQYKESNFSIVFNLLNTLQNYIHTHMCGVVCGPLFRIIHYDQKVVFLRNRNNKVTTKNATKCETINCVIVHIRKKS